MKSWADYGIEGIDPKGKREQRVRCPECQRHKKRVRRKNLSVNVEKQVWKCHACGWKGTLLLGGEWHKFRPLAEVRYEPSQEEVDATIVRGWLHARGITAEAQYAYNVSAIRTERGQTMAAFPYQVMVGERPMLVGVKYRATDGSKTMFQEPDPDLALWGIDRITPDDETVVITEGEMDALSCYVAGYKAAVSLAFGAPGPNDDLGRKFDHVENSKRFLWRATRIIIATDGDANGRRAAEVLASMMGEERCCVVHWPENRKDANDVLTLDGPAALAALLASAEPWPVALQGDTTQMWAEVAAVVNEGFPVGFRTGLQSLDDTIRWHRGKMYIITGIPSHGKSVWLDNVMVRLAERNPIMRYSMFSPENDTAELLVRLMTIALGRPYLEASPTEQEQARLFVAAHFRPPHDITRVEKSVTLEMVLDTFAADIERYGVNFCVVDPFTEIDIPANERQYNEWIAGALTTLRRFAAEHHVVMVVVAHPRKMPSRADGTFPVPTLYDIAGSHTWYAKADIGLTVYRESRVTKGGEVIYDGQPDPTHIYVQKVKHEYVGKKGKVTLYYKPKVHQFGEDALAPMRSDDDMAQYFGNINWDM